MIIATLFLVETVINELSDGQIKCFSLVKGNENPHTFQLKPSHLRKMRKAKVFIHMGMNLEPWKDKIIENLPKKAIVVDLSKNMKKIKGNPHWWLDPDNAQKMISEISSLIVYLKPELSEKVSKKSAVMINRIEKLKQRYREAFKKLERKSVVSQTMAFTYMLRYFGIDEYIFQALPGQRISFKKMNRIVAEAKKRKVIVANAIIKSPIVEEIARRSSAKVTYCSPLPGFLEGTSDLVSLLEVNLKNLYNALADQS